MSSKTQTQAAWIYGVVPADASLEELERRGDGLPEVWLVESGDLAAIVGPAPGDDAMETRNQALAHARVLEAAVVDAPVVPFRFGTVAAGGDEEVAAELLEPRHDELAALLDQVDGRVQMVLKVYYREDAVLEEIVDSEPEIGRLREEIQDQPEEATRDLRMKLGELVDTALEQRRGRDSAEMLGLIEPAAAGIVTGALEDEYMVLNADVLVEREAQQDFEATVEEIAQERQERMRFRLLGPMPAYSFIGTVET